MDSDRYKWIALSNTTLGVLLATLDASIILIAMPNIFRGIKLDPLVPGNSFYLLWMILGYLVVTSVLIVSLGRLGDMYGRVRIYNLGFVIYTVASLLLAIDWMTGTSGATYLIGFRIVQGIGGACLLANAAAIITDAFPANQRGLALGINNIVGVSGMFVGLVLGGLLAPTGGRVTAFGDPRPPHKWKATTLTERIGSVFQNPEHQFVTARVADELAVGPRRLGRGDAAIRETVDALLDRLRLTKLAQANPYTLSGGEARRLSVATALATAPRLLVLDEPTFGQDRRTWIELVTLLATLRDEGHAVVAITHDDDFVQTLADRTFALGSARLRDPLPRRRPS